MVKDVVLLRFIYESKNKLKYRELPQTFKCLPYKMAAREYFSQMYGECEVLFAVPDIAEDPIPNSTKCAFALYFVDSPTANRIKQKYNGRVLFGVRLSNCWLESSQMFELDINEDELYAKKRHPLTRSYSISPPPEKKPAAKWISKKERRSPSPYWYSARPTSRKSRYSRSPSPQRSKVNRYSRSPSPRRSKVMRSSQSPSPHREGRSSRRDRFTEKRDKDRVEHRDTDDRRDKRGDRRDKDSDTRRRGSESDSQTSLERDSKNRDRPGRRSEREERDSERERESKRSSSGHRSHSPHGRRRPVSNEGKHTSTKLSYTSTSKSTHITTTSDKVRSGAEQSQSETDASSVRVTDQLDRTKKLEHSYQQTKEVCPVEAVKSLSLVPMVKAEQPSKLASCANPPQVDVTPDKLVHNRQSLSTTPLQSTPPLYRDETPPAELVEASQFLAEGQFSEWYREKFHSNPYALQQYVQHYYETAGEPVDQDHMTKRHDHMMQEESRVTAPRDQDRLVTSDSRVQANVHLFSDNPQDTQQWWNTLDESNMRADHMLPGLHTDRQQSLPPPPRRLFNDPHIERNQPSPVPVSEDPFKLRNQPIPPRPLSEDPFKLRNQPIPPRPLLEDPFKQRNQPSLIPSRPLSEDPFKQRNQPIPPRPLLEDPFKQRNQPIPLRPLLEDPFKQRNQPIPPRPLLEDPFKLRNQPIPPRPLSEDPFKLRNQPIPPRPLSEDQFKQRLVSPTRRLCDDPHLSIHPDLNYKLQPHDQQSDRRQVPPLSSFTQYRQKMATQDSMLTAFTPITSDLQTSLAGSQRSAFSSSPGLSSSLSPPVFPTTGPDPSRKEAPGTRFALGQEGISGACASFPLVQIPRMLGDIEQQGLHALRTGERSTPVPRYSVREVDQQLSETHFLGEETSVPSAHSFREEREWQLPVLYAGSMPKSHSSTRSDESLVPRPSFQASQSQVGFGSSKLKEPHGQDGIRGTRAGFPLVQIPRSLGDIKSIERSAPVSHSFLGETDRQCFNGRTPTSMTPFFSAEDNRQRPEAHTFIEGSMPKTRLVNEMDGGRDERQHTDSELYSDVIPMATPFSKVSTPQSSGLPFTQREQLDSREMDSSGVHYTSTDHSQIYSSTRHSGPLLQPARFTGPGSIEQAGFSSTQSSRQAGTSSTQSTPKDGQPLKPGMKGKGQVICVSASSQTEVVKRRSKVEDKECDPPKRAIGPEYGDLQKAIKQEFMDQAAMLALSTDVLIKSNPSQREMLIISLEESLHSLCDRLENKLWTKIDAGQRT